MAVSPMQKVQIYAHLSEKERLVERLQNVGTLHVVDFQENYPGTDGVTSLGAVDMQAYELEETVTAIEFASKCLAEFEPTKGILSKLSGEKVLLNPEEYKQIVHQTDYHQVVDKCKQLHDARVHFTAERIRLMALRKQLLAWVPLDIPLEQIKATRSVSVVLGSLLGGKLAQLESELSEITDQFEIVKINHDDNHDYILLLCSREFFAQLKERLGEFNFSAFSVAELVGTPRQMLRELDVQLESDFQEQEKITQENNKLAGFRPQLLVLTDHYSNLLQQKLIQANFARTVQTFVVEGWVAQKQLPAFQKSIEAEFEAVTVLPAEPLPGEEPPVLLENPKVVEPFRMITDLYGTPRYFDVDPSLPLAPFFVIALGMCITDAGYGAVLALFSYLALRLFRFGQGTRRLLQVCLWGGFSTVVIGILTGGYFGINFDSLPQTLQALKAFRSKTMLFDPLKNPLIFLGIALAFGFIQICVGLIIRLYRNVRDRMFWAAIMDQVSWLGILNGLLIFGLGKGGILPPTMATFGKWLTLTGVAIVVLFAGRGQKNVLARFGAGLFSLYGITGYFGDVLSYSRLLALGMATSVIALVVNTIAAMVSHIPVVGVVAMLVVLIGGHLFNIAINLLSGFIHTMRLQFVEFFSKFLEAGGKEFKPFRKQYQFLLVTRQE